MRARRAALPALGGRLLSVKRRCRLPLGKREQRSGGLGRPLLNRPGALVVAIQYAGCQLCVNARDLLRGPPEPTIVLGGPADLWDPEIGPSPILPVHVLRNPSPPRSIPIDFPGGVETLAEDRNDVEVLLRDGDLRVP
eukprot:2358884-Alexandrium_andersonii.AAC.1